MNIHKWQTTTTKWKHKHKHKASLFKTTHQQLSKISEKGEKKGFKDQVYIHPKGTPRAAPTYIHNFTFITGNGEVSNQQTVPTS